MMKRLVTLAVGSLALVACGPGAKIDGKNGAAQALLAASQPTKQGADTNGSPALTPGLSWNCPEGGKADFTGAGISIGVGQNTNVSQSLTLKYSGCGIAKSDVGVAVYNGSITLSQNVNVSGSNVTLDQSFKGKVLVQGAFDDFFDADVTQQIAVGDLGTTGAGVAMTLKGSIATSEGSFTFDEMLTVTSGTISAKLSTSR